MRSVRCGALLGLGLLLAACGGSGPADDGAAASVAETPARAGEAWELVDGGVAEAPSPAAVAAFVEGLHAFVLDGEHLYAGNLRHTGSRQADGSLLFPLGNDLQARLLQDGETLLLHLGEGDPARLQRRAGDGGGAP